MSKLIFLIFLASHFINSVAAQQVKIAKMKYSGGGDWYANKTALPNLIEFCNNELNTAIESKDYVVEIDGSNLYQFPYIYLTGHGNIVFSENEAKKLRAYLMAGGFLHIDDNYGLDPFIRLEMKKVFPEKDFVEIPFDHPIYHQKFNFEHGLPKIHEHDGQPAQGLGILHNGRLVCFYSYESDLGNGWEDASIHNDPEQLRQKALKMGANIISFAFTQE